MSEVTFKARVLLLNESTGEAMGECDIITNSKEIFYNNPSPLPEPVGNIPAGTIFDNVSLSDILDNILYNKKIEPFISNIISSNGDITGSSKHIKITKLNGSQVDDFTLSMDANFGTYKNITINLYKYTGDDTETDSVSLSKDSTDTVPVIFNITGFDKDTDIWLEIINDDDSTVVSKTGISYKFVSPIWVGWIKPDTLDENGALSKETAEHNFQELIDHSFKTLEKRIVDKSDQQAFVVPNINYSTRENLNPCILVPQSWGQVQKIVDTNGNNITNSFAHVEELDINTNGIYIEHYIAYICKYTFADDNRLIGGITYVWDDPGDININIFNLLGTGIPTTSGFSMQCGIPLDDRYYCKTYKDLLGIVYPYPGLQSYVEEINTTFRFEKGHWTPVSTKTHVVEDASKLTEDFGGWDDIAINAMDGKIWKKRYNNQWERYGDIKAEDGKVIFSTN